MSALWMIVASLLFACMGVCVKLGAAKFSVPELVFYRGILASLLLFVYIHASGRTLATPHWRAHLQRCAAGIVSLSMYYYAISVIPLATAVTLSYTSPLFLALILVFWLGEKVRRLVLVSVAAGLVGVALLLQPSLDSGQLSGEIFGLSSGILASLVYLNVRRLGELGEPVWRTVIYFSLMMGLGGLLWTLSGLLWAPGDFPFHRVDAEGAWLLAGVAVFGLLGQLCMTSAYKHGRTVVSASLSYSTVIFASVFGVLLWGEDLPLIAWIGIAVIVASGALTSALAHAAPLDQD